MEFMLQPWPWYIAGPLIGLTVPLLLLLTGKTFGISSSLRHIGSVCTPNSRFAYVRDNNWRENSWSLVLVTGIVLGSFVAAHYLSAEPTNFLPESFNSASGAIKLAIGGLLIGFGTRYAGGCTSGHTITGLSNLQWPSLVASIFFFVGGLLTTYLLGSLF